MTNFRPMFPSSGTMWDAAEIKRARKPLRCEGPKLPARNSAGQAIVGKIMAHGEGAVVKLVNGQKIHVQVWADHPSRDCVWLKAYEGDASFPGEMFVGQVDRTGRITAVNFLTPYTASGKRFYSQAA